MIKSVYQYYIEKKFAKKFAAKAKKKNGLSASACVRMLVLEYLDKP